MPPSAECIVSLTILQCKHRKKNCVYTQSKRGGARIRKKAAITERKPSANNSELNHCPLSILPQLEEIKGKGFGCKAPLSDYELSASFTGPLSLVAPGGGLKQLDVSFDDSDFMFDTVFTGEDEVLSSESRSPDYPLSEDLPQYPIRVYSSDDDM
jgi:hypothetical protein